MGLFKNVELKLSMSAGWNDKCKLLPHLHPHSKKIKIKAWLKVGLILGENLIYAIYKQLRKNSNWKFLGLSANLSLAKLYG
jgi:hypothetical protein